MSGQAVGQELTNAGDTQIAVSGNQVAPRDSVHSNPGPAGNHVGPNVVLRLPSGPGRRSEAPLQKNPNQGLLASCCGVTQICLDYRRNEEAYVLSPLLSLPSCTYRGGLCFQGRLIADGISVLRSPA